MSLTQFIEIQFSINCTDNLDNTLVVSDFHRPNSNQSFVAHRPYADLTLASFARYEPFVSGSVLVALLAEPVLVVSALPGSVLVVSGLVVPAPVVPALVWSEVSVALAH